MVSELLRLANGFTRILRGDAQGLLLLGLRMSLASTLCQQGCGLVLSASNEFYEDSNHSGCGASMNKADFVWN